MTTYTWKIIQECEFGKVGDIVDIVLPVSKYDEFKEDFAQWLERYIDIAPASYFDGHKNSDMDCHTDNTFKEVLAKIGEAHPGSAVAERYRKNKTIKEVKTAEIVKKHKQKALKGR